MAERERGEKKSKKEKRKQENIVLEKKKLCETKEIYQKEEAH